MFNMLNLLEQQGTLLPPFFLLLCFVFLLVFRFKCNKSRTKEHNLPPSPRKLPIIGNLHQLGSFPHRTLRSFAQRHGPLMLLHFGRTPTLVVSSAKAAGEVMKTHDLIFSSRPDSSITRRLLYDKKDLVFAPYGEYWRQMRKICVLQLLSMKRIQSYRVVREEETTLMIEKIRRSCSSSPSFSALVNLSETLSSLTYDIIYRVVLGKKYSGQESGRRFGEMMRELVALLGVFDVGDFIPSLAWLNYISGLDTRVEKCSKELDCFFDRVIEDHIHRNASKDGLVSESDDGDFVDFLLGMEKENTAGIRLERDSIKAITLDMFGAGTDTTHTVLEWAMAELIRHPEVMKEVQEEVRGIVGGKTKIAEDDIEQMQHLKSVIKETLRLHPPVPLLVPRESTEDTKIHGYDILAKTTVIINAWAIGRDPVSWEEAEEFRSKRFLNAASAVDFKGLDFQLIPFGAGRRGCPGIEFAIAVNELALASLLHKFDWALPDGASGVDLDMTEAYGLTTHLKSPLSVVATPHYSW